jgi:hypothetical protein
LSPRTWRKLIRALSNTPLILTKAMQEQQSQIEALEGDNDNQAKAINDLRQQFEAYKKAHP